MPILQTALEFIAGVLIENEEIKKFPKDFVNASALWVRSWFLKDDPKTAEKLADPSRSADNKKGLLEPKLEALLENEQFVKELEQHLKTFAEHKSTQKNVVVDADIEALGDVHIGDKGASAADDSDEKNIIKGGTIKAGKDFHLGDDLR
jgi:hypothetical protein